MLIGRLGRDPEMRYTGSGTPVCNFTLATDEGFKDKSGEWQKRTEWHRIVAWARLAEQDREGNKRRTTEIVIQRMRLLTPKGEPGLEMGAGPEPPEDTAPEITDEDVPF
jgi:single-strand DNA-binding protein